MSSTSLDEMEGPHDVDDDLPDLLASVVEVVDGEARHCGVAADAADVDAGLGIVQRVDGVGIMGEGYEQLPLNLPKSTSRFDSDSSGVESPLSHLDNQV